MRVPARSRWCITGRYPSATVPSASRRGGELPLARRRASGAHESWDGFEACSRVSRSVVPPWRQVCSSGDVLGVWRYSDGNDHAHTRTWSRAFQGPVGSNVSQARRWCRAAGRMADGATGAASQRGFLSLVSRP